MAFNGTGTYVVASAGQPAVAGVIISSTVHNALTADLATGLSTAICRDGQSTTTARIIFAQGVSSTLATDATSTTTGSIITAGGISCVKALWVGGLANIAGGLTVTGNIVTPAAVVADLELQTKNGVVYLGPTAAATECMFKTDGAIIIKARLADDSGYATFDAGIYKVGGTQGADFNGSGATFAALTTVTFVKGILTVAS